MIKKCARCGNEFEAHHGNTKYCSKACHREVKLECLKRWREKCPEKVRTHNQQYLAEHREQHKIYQRNRRAAKKRLKWIEMRAARLRKILEEKAAARQAAQPKREPHWSEYSSLSLVSSCQATLIY